MQPARARALAPQALLRRRHEDAGVGRAGRRVDGAHSVGVVLHVLEHLAALAAVGAAVLGHPVGVAAAKAQDAVQPGVVRRILLWGATGSGLSSCWKQRDHAQHLHCHALTAAVHARYQLQAATTTLGVRTAWARSQNMTPAQDPCRLADVRQLSYASLYCAGLWSAEQAARSALCSAEIGIRLCWPAITLPVNKRKMCWVLTSCPACSQTPPAPLASPDPPPQLAAAPRSMSCAMPSRQSQPCCGLSVCTMQV